MSSSSFRIISSAAYSIRTLYDLRNRFFRNAIHQDLQTDSGERLRADNGPVTNDMETVGNGMKILYGRVISEPSRILASGANRLLDQLAADASILDPRSDVRL